MASKAILEYIGPIPTGRPSSFTQDKADEILGRLWEGESLTRICSDSDMPGLRTVYKWADRNEQFGRDYTQARARQADTFAELMQDVAGNLEIPHEHKRQMIDVMKWRAARQNWRAWGDRVQHDHTLEVRPAHGKEGLPAGLGWLAGQLPSAEPRPEPGDSGVGEE